MPSVGVILTQHKHPKWMQDRAAKSVEEQTRRPDVIGGTSSGHPDTGFASWLIAAHECPTDYIAILHDDDWYEPTFIERTLELMDDETAYVFTEATIHFPDRTQLNFGFGCGTGAVPSGSIAEMQLGSPIIISPSCALYRRSDLLHNLIPGGAPGMPRNDKFCGPDLLMSLLPLLDYPKVGFVADPLVNFDGHDQSTTIANMKADGGAELSVNYESARKLFAMLSAAKRVMR